MFLRLYHHLLVHSTASLADAIAGTIILRPMISPGSVFKAYNEMETLINRHGMGL